MRSRLFYVAMAIVMGTIGLVAALALDGVQEMAADLDQTEADNAKINADLNEQESASQALAEQVKRLGGKPVVDPGESANTAPGPVFATQAQVNEAVSVICTGTPACRPTEAQVKTTLRAICGDCRGEDAKPPRDGTNGQNATPEQIDAAIARQIDAAVARHCAEGACQGPPPTTEQLDERIAAYCSQDGNCGEDGKDAVIVPSGMDCPEGERVNGVHLLADGSLTVSCAPLIGLE